jgi:BexC/CtrB/KpsE family polysaccharide export inner-membrane protein
MDQTLITRNFRRKLNRSKALKRVNILFLFTVIVPTSLAMLYFGLIASDIYVSQAQFVVRSPDKPSTTGLGILLKSVGFSNAGDEIFATQDYVVSRDALRALNQKDAVERAYTRPGISVFDRFNPLGWNGSFEDLYEYYRDKVGIEHDAKSSITTLSVMAFSAEDAFRFNKQLLAQAEGLVNRLNSRGQNDLVEYAKRETEEAEQAGLSASRELARYRDQRGVIDPERQATVQLQMVSKLQDELIGARTQLAQLRALAPENPQIPVLETRIGALTREIAAALGQVTGASSSLSATAVRYQRLQLEREFAEKRLTAALTSLQEARNEARRQQAYVERIVQPSLPDEAQQPRRLRGILATFVLGLVAFGVLTMLLAGIREHKD